MDEIKTILDTLQKIEEKQSQAVNKDELARLAEEQSKMATQLMDLQQKGIQTRISAPKTKSIGEQVLESDSFKALRDGSSVKCRIEVGEVKAEPASVEVNDEAVNPMLSPTGGVVVAYRRPGVLSGAFRPLTIESLLPQVPIATNAFEYVQEKNFVNGAAFVAEGAQKPFSSVEFELKSGTIKTIAHLARVSKQMLEDAPALIAYINTRMTYGVDLAVEDQIISGDGTGQNLSGLFTDGNFTAHGAKQADLGSNGNLLDLILFAKTKLSNAFFRPNVILLNPSDWASLQMTKNNSGEYYLTHPSTVAQPLLWGISVKVSPAIPVGKFMVMDTAQAATLWVRSGLTIEIFEQDADNVQKNLVTIRAERRLGMGVERPLAMVGGALTVPTT